MIVAKCPSCGFIGEPDEYGVVGCEDGFVHCNRCYDDFQVEWFDFKEVDLNEAKNNMLRQCAGLISDPVLKVKIRYLLEGKLTQ